MTWCAIRTTSISASQSGSRSSCRFLFWEQLPSSLVASHLSGRFLIRPCHPSTRTHRPARAIAFAAARSAPPKRVPSSLQQLPLCVPDASASSTQRGQQARTPSQSRSGAPSAEGVIGLSCSHGPGARSAAVASSLRPPSHRPSAAPPGARRVTDAPRRAALAGAPPRRSYPARCCRRCSGCGRTWETAPTRCSRAVGGQPERPSR